MRGRFWGHSVYSYLTSTVWEGNRCWVSGGILWWRWEGLGGGGKGWVEVGRTGRRLEGLGEGGKGWVKVGRAG